MLREVRRIAKPWGYELVFAHTDRYVGKILHVEPGQALSLQYHERKDETLYLAAGSARTATGRLGMWRDLVPPLPAPRRRPQRTEA